MAALVFLIAVFVLCILVSVISWPRGGVISISREGEGAFLYPGREYFALEAGKYQVLNEFGKYITQNSAFFYPVEYYYFNVLVTDGNGERFVMAVRVNRKAADLREGKPVPLYGMMSELDKKALSAQSAGLIRPENVNAVYPVCLNDNDSSLPGRYLQSLIFAGIAVFLVLLIIRIIKRM